MKIFKVGVRVNILGGWSDQADWKFPGAVVNASVGWETQSSYSPFPMRCADVGGRLEWASQVEGQGTGLGISSIRYAVEHIANHPGEAYTPAVLAREQTEGTKGGWQDAIGALTPGLKLLESSDDRFFYINNAPLDVPLVESLVLFDTGIRRPAKTIGDKVRKGMAEEGAIVRCLKRHVQEAHGCTSWDTERIAKTAIEQWKRLTEIVPEMAVPMPAIRYAWGSMLVGAGGGGFGITFCTDPGERENVIEQYQRHGWWATKLVLMDGLKIEEI